MSAHGKSVFIHYIISPARACSLTACRACFRSEIPLYPPRKQFKKPNRPVRLSLLMVEIWESSYSERTRKASIFVVSCLRKRAACHGQSPFRAALPLSPPSAREKEKDPNESDLFRQMVELKAAKTHTVLYQINRTEYYCQVDLPLSDYPLYGKQLVASLKQY